MSEHDTPIEPIDKAYRQAEAMLNDDAARDARRARVLAAVTREAAEAPPVRGPVERFGPWLAAASVAGLSLLVATRLYQPPPHPPLSARGPVAAATSIPPKGGAPPAVAAPAPAPPTMSRAAPIAPETATPVAPPPPALADTRQVASTPPPLFIAPADRSFAPPPPPPPPPAPPIVAEGLQYSSPPAADSAGSSPLGARDETTNEQGVASAPARGALMPSAKAAPSRARSPSDPLPPPDGAVKLRDAAAAGRTGESPGLVMDCHVPVDAPDANGETALMLSIKADHPIAAALLRRYGASLDRRNRAGVSARDMAIAIGDPELDKALGLAP